MSSDTGPWAAVPAWVIGLPISDRAVRLYAYLSLRADGGTGDGGETRGLTRRDLAATLVCSVNSLDRAVVELEKAGAIRRQAQTDAAGDCAANQWHVYRSRPDARTVPQEGLPLPSVGGTPLPTGGEAYKGTRPKPQTQDLEVASHFDVFWAAYPRHIAKPEARKAWTKATRSVEPDVIVAGAVRYASQCQDHGTEPQFIPYPQKWLNAGRWDDEPTPVPRTNGRRPGNVERSFANIANAPSPRGFDDAPNGSERSPGRDVSLLAATGDDPT